MVYQMVSRTDAETMRFLNDVIILFVQDNPDGQELVANWYMRNADPLKRSGAGLPRLWHKYIGHDNNRDFFMCNMPESTNINRVLYREWYPQIMYNHHQTGPPGAVIFMPPFRDPFNYHFDPLIMMELDQVGSAMHARMEAEDKPGAGMRTRGHLLDLVQRRSADDDVLSQHDRAVDGDHWQSHTDGYSAGARDAIGARRSAVSDCAAKVAFAAID